MHDRECSLFSTRESLFAAIFNLQASSNLSHTIMQDRVAKDDLCAVLETCCSESSVMLLQKQFRC